MKRGFACGVFDLFHAGHVLMLQECKRHCDYLIVAVNAANRISKIINPNKRSPIYSIEERRLILSSCRYIDEVLVYDSEDELIHILNTYNIHVRFLGDDYKDKAITAYNLGIDIYYIDRSHGYSTTNLVNKIKNIK